MRFTLVPWNLDLYRNAIKKMLPTLLHNFCVNCSYFFHNTSEIKYIVQEKLQNKTVKIPRNVYELVYILAEILGNLAS